MGFRPMGAGQAPAQNQPSAPPTPDTSQQPTSQPSGGFRPLNHQQPQNPITQNLTSQDPKVATPTAQKMGAEAGGVFDTMAKFMIEHGGRDSFLGKIGNLLGEGAEQTTKDLAGMGVSAYNVAKQVPKIAEGVKKGKVVKDELSTERTLPILGKTKPFFTGKEKAPEFIGKVATGGLEVAGAIEGVRGAPGIVKDVKSFGTGVKDVVTQGVKNLGSKLAEDSSKSEVVTGIKKVGEKLKSLPEAVSKKTGSIFKGKSFDDIMATAEKDVKKLSPKEREVYFNQKSKELASRHEEEMAAIKSRAQEKTTSIKKEYGSRIDSIKESNKQLDREATTASAEEAQKLKPKVIESMKKNSQEYRNLVDKEMKGKGKSPVDKHELQTYIEERYKDDPKRVSDMKEKLGLSEKVDPMSTKQSKLKTKTTLEDIYNQAKGLRQDIKGKKIYDASDKLTDDSIRVLSEFMKKKGVDLSEANKFWSEYAPLRDKLIKNVQPFTPKGSESSTFNTFVEIIKKSTQGVDPKNANFIKATEDLLGEKIGSQETKTAIEKLSQGEKQKLATEIEKVTKLEKAQAEAEFKKMMSEKSISKEKENIELKRFNAERDSRIRTGIKRIIGATIAYGTARTGYDYFVK